MNRNITKQYKLLYTVTTSNNILVPDKDTCIYCAEPADTMDHCPAVNTNHMNLDYPHYLSPCCRECNSLLGDKYFNTISERASYLITTYKKRYRNLINQPSWSENELKGLSGRLKTGVKGYQMSKERLWDRLDAIEHRELMDDQDMVDKTFNRPIPKKSNE